MSKLLSGNEKLIQCGGRPIRIGEVWMRVGVSAIALEQHSLDNIPLRPEDIIRIVYCVYKDSHPRRLFYIINGDIEGDYFEFPDRVMCGRNMRSYSIMHEISPTPTRFLHGWVWQPRPL